jgi:hypothetical protein
MDNALFEISVVTLWVVVDAASVCYHFGKHTRLRLHQLFMRVHLGGGLAGKFTRIVDTLGRS